MALRIIRESDPIEVTQLSVCIYSVPGIGKTSTGFTADDPFLLDFDKGAYRSRNRRDCGRPESWEDVCDIEADVRPFKTIIVDTAGRALDLLTSDIIKQEPKLGRGGALTLQGYGVLRNRFVSWLKQVKSLGKDPIMLVHSDEQKKGDETVERLDVQGGSKNEIYKSADVMGRLFTRDGERYLNFNPTDTNFGKNPVQLSELKVPDFSLEPNWLGGVIRDIKAKLNAQTELQMAAAAFLEGWRTKLEAITDPMDFTLAIEDLKSTDCSEAQRGVVKRLIHDKAVAKGFAFDKTAKSYVVKAA